MTRQTHAAVTVAGRVVPVLVPLESIPCPTCAATGRDCAGRAGSAQWHPRRAELALRMARELVDALRLGTGYVVRVADGSTAPRAVAECYAEDDARAHVDELRRLALLAGAEDDGPGAVRWRAGYRTAWTIARPGMPALERPAAAPRAARAARARDGGALALF